MVGECSCHGEDMRKKRSFGLQKQVACSFGGLAIVLLWWIGIIWRTITRVDVPKEEKVVANNKAKAKTSKNATNTKRKKKRNVEKATPAVSLPGRNSAKVQDKVERRGVAFTISSLGTSKNFCQIHRKP